MEPTDDGTNANRPTTTASIIILSLSFMAFITIAATATMALVHPAFSMTAIVIGIGIGSAAVMCPAGQGPSHYREHAGSQVHDHDHDHDHDHTLGGATGSADGGDVDAPQGPVREGCGNTARILPRWPDARHGHGTVRAGDSTYDLGKVRSRDEGKEECAGAAQTDRPGRA